MAANRAFVDHTRPFLLLLICIIPCCFPASAQDSLLVVEKKNIMLKEVVVRSNLNVPAFIERVKNDTTFYKAFRNLRILEYTALNDIRMMDKQGRQKASLNSRTRQHAHNGCRWTEVLEEQVTGDMYNKKRHLNYYTAEMYAGLFFAPDTVCGENNLVKDVAFTLKGKKGLEKHKEQLKMLFFNPGKKIPGIPFIGNKIALFDEDVAARYDFLIDMDAFRGEMCYVFSLRPRGGDSARKKDNIVVDELVTWFNINTWEIVARKYSLSYKAGVYDFDVHMEVEMTKFGEYLVPQLMRYHGSWDVVFKKRENGVFTATLFDFGKPL